MRNREKAGKKMGKVSFNMSMSLDGYVAGPNDEVDSLFGWYFAGDTEFPFPSSNYTFKVSPASAALLEEVSKTVGAMITGRRNFDLANAWGGHPPLGVHHFVVTHHPAREWVKDGSPFTFVTDGVASAIQQAKAYAGEKDVVISSGAIMRQALEAGLLDELNIDLVPVLLGKGLRLFESLDSETIALEITQVVEGTGVTHLRYRVVK
jgi:dihydrofolate reductase